MMDVEMVTTEDGDYDVWNANLFFLDDREEEEVEDDNGKDNGRVNIRNKQLWWTEWMPQILKKSQKLLKSFTCFDSDGEVWGVK